MELRGEIQHFPASLQTVEVMVLQRGTLVVLMETQVAAEPGGLEEKQEVLAAHMEMLAVMISPEVLEVLEEVVPGL
jgi:hypothetical protein|tara:strand:- start:197 stop:424 length:228 start_codon:yes stop_codon:yes gene_type:complete